MQLSTFDRPLIAAEDDQSLIYGHSMNILPLFNEELENRYKKSMISMIPPVDIPTLAVACFMFERSELRKYFVSI